MTMTNETMMNEAMTNETNEAAKIRLTHIVTDMGDFYTSYPNVLSREKRRRLDNQRKQDIDEAIATLNDYSAPFQNWVDEQAQIHEVESEDVIASLRTLIVTDAERVGNFLEALIRIEHPTRKFGDPMYNIIIPSLLEAP